MQTRSLPLHGLLAVLLCGCGLISSDLTKLTFDLPNQTYSFDTAKWGNLPPPAVGATFPSISCTSDAQCCNDGSLVGVSCSMTPLTCPASTCEAQIPESTYSPVNLAMQVGALATFPGHSLVDVTIESITYTVSDNTLNVDLPPISIYLAPDGVTDPTDPSATLFGTVPSIQAGTNPTGSVTKTANADAAFEMYTKNVSTTFNIIAGATVVIDAGTPVPNGHITVTVGGTVAAQL
ncbi:MAG TPA: hypothetical protein VMT03_01925 [Polyangia bacterium]|nr:hypothetical protein [Polyangia bacterium]